MNVRTADILAKACIGLCGFLEGVAVGLYLAKSYDCPEGARCHWDDDVDADSDDFDELDDEEFQKYKAEKQEIAKKLNDKLGYSGYVLNKEATDTLLDALDEEEADEDLEDVEEWEDDISYTETVEEQPDGTAIVGTEYGEEVDEGPYIVSTDSYMNEYQDFSKNTLTYYEEDEVLCDENDQVVYTPEEYIGSDALDSFGEGSDDANIVYVRNLRKHSDYEVVRDPGSYEEKVLGFPDEEEYKKARKALNLDEE